MRPSLLIVVLLLASTSAARSLATTPPINDQSKTPPRSSNIVQRPVWLSQPTRAQLAAAHPSRALRSDLSGIVQLSCVVGPDGGLRNCRVASETPEGYGFGEAALRLAPRYRMADRNRDGFKVTGKHVRVPVRFLLP